MRRSVLLALAATLLVAVRPARADTPVNLMFANSDGSAGSVALVFGMPGGGFIGLFGLTTGAYGNLGHHVATNPTYMAGTCPPLVCGGYETEYRDYFVFDLPTFTVRPESMTLVAYNPSLAKDYTDGYQSALPFLGVILHDVTTPVRQLIQPQVGRVDIYDDLGDGAVYGTKFVTAATNGQKVFIPLEDAAIDDAMAAAGQPWALGGSVIAPGIGGPGTTTPEPAPVALLAAGLLALAVAGARRRPRAAAIALGTLLAVAAPVAHADAQTLTFEGIDTFAGGSLAPIGSYYAGGAGPSYGVTFSGDARALCLSTAQRACSNSSRGDRGDPASQGAGLLFLGGSPSFIDSATGFDTALSFFYAGAESENTVDVWSGAGGTGALLATMLLPRTPTGPGPCYGAQYCPFVPVTVAFAGVARSVTFAGATQELVLDDVAFGAPPPVQSVPEPAAAPLLGAGLLALGTTVRARRARAVA